jgi:isopentenyl-diphosphate Delta-isomerase
LAAKDDNPQMSSRKADHIRINLEKDVRSARINGLDDYFFIHQAVPELNLDEVDLSLSMFGKKLSAPILISSMTGGTAEARQINRVLAETAQEEGIAMGLGSQRSGIENPELISTFQVRDIAPDILLFANLGAVQLNYHYTSDDCQRAVDMVQADALILHFNPLQEALQPEGNTNFSGLVKKIEQVCHHISVPVIAKEVGWGISAQAARLLSEAGIQAIDVAGAGGTSWSQVEMYRNPDEYLAQVAAAFRDWGIPTADSLIQIHSQYPEIKLIASGGIRNGIDIAKCIALGAELGGMAGKFLKSAVQSKETVRKTIDQTRREIQISMFAAGIPDLAQLHNTTLVRASQSRGINECDRNGFSQWH